MNSGIVHVITSLTANGAERLVTDLICRMKHEGVESRILSLFPAKTGQLAAQLDKAGIAHMCLHKKNWKDVSLLPDLRRQLMAIKPALVHAHLFPANYVVPFCSPKKAKLITTEHSVTTRRRKNKAGKIADRFIYKKYDRIICISDDVAVSLAGWTGINDSLMVIENGVDLERFTIDRSSSLRQKFGIPDTAVVVGMAGRFEQPPKDQETIIKAVAALPDVHCIFAGDGPDMQKLQKTAEDAQCRARIHFAGYLDCVEELYASVNIYIHSSFYEGFGLSILEAMASGVPVIGSDVKAINSIVNNSINGLLFKQGDAAALTERIRVLSSDATLKNKLIACAFQTAKKYSFTTMIQKYKDLYALLLNGNCNGC